MGRWLGVISATIIFFVGLNFYAIKYNKINSGLVLTQKELGNYRHLAAELKKKLQHYQDIAQRYQKKAQELEKEVNSLKTGAGSRQLSGPEKKTFKNMIKTLLQENEQLRTQLDKTSTMLKKVRRRPPYKRKYLSLRDELFKLKSRQRALEQKNRELNRIVSRLSKLEPYQRKFISLEKQYRNLKLSSQRLENELKMRQSQIDSLQAAKNSLQKDLEDKTLLLKQFRTKLQQLGSEMEIKEKLWSKIGREKETLKKDLETKVSLLNKSYLSLNELKSQIQLKDKQISSLQSESQAKDQLIQRLKNELNSSQKSLSGLQKRMEKLTKAKNELALQLEEIKKEKQSLKDNLVKTNAILSKVEKEKAASESALNNLNTRNTQLQQQLAEKEKEINSLQAQLSQLKSSLKGLQLSNETLSKNLNDFNLQIQNLKSQMALLKNEKEKIQIDRDAYFKEIKDLRQKLNLVKKDRDKFIAEIERLKDNINSVYSDLVKINSVLPSSLLEADIKKIKDMVKGGEKSVEVSINSVSSSSSLLTGKETTQSATKKISLSKASSPAATADNNVSFSKADYYYNRGVDLFKSRKYRTAVEMFKKAYRFNPQDSDSCYNLGIIYDEYLDSPRRAKVWYERFLKLKPEGEDAERVREYLQDLR